MAKRPNAEVQERIVHAPFIRIEDGFYEDLFVDHRRIISIRPSSYRKNPKQYPSEQHSAAVIVEEGTRLPYGVQDKPEFILDLIRAAGGGATFITLSFEDGGKIFVDSQRITSLKEDPSRDSGSVLFIDGYPNVSEGEATWSIIVTDSVEDILRMIRQAAMA